MNEIRIDTSKGRHMILRAPASWNEMDEKRLVSWAAIVLKKMSLENSARMALLMMYDIPVKIFIPMSDVLKIQLADTIKFLYSPVAVSKWVIPTMKIKLTSYYGPSDRLENVTIGEYAKLEFYYQVYVKRGSEQALDMLIATLYREKRKGTPVNGDIRRDLEDLDTRRRAERMSKLPKKVRHAILLNYEGVKYFINKHFLSKLDSESNAEGEISDLRKTILAVSGGKFGNFNDTRDTLLYDFLQHLVENDKEIKRIRKESKR